MRPQGKTTPVIRMGEQVLPMTLFSVTSWISWRSAELERDQRVDHQLPTRVARGDVRTIAIGHSAHLNTVCATELNTAWWSRLCEGQPTTTNAAAADSATNAGPAAPDMRRW